MIKDYFSQLLERFCEGLQHFFIFLTGLSQAIAIFIGTVSSAPAILLPSRSQNLLYGFAFGQFVNQFIELTALLH